MNSNKRNVFFSLLLFLLFSALPYKGGMNSIPKHLFHCYASCWGLRSLKTKTQLGLPNSYSFCQGFMPPAGGQESPKKITQLGSQNS